MGYFPPPRTPLTARLRLWFGWQICRLIGHRLEDRHDAHTVTVLDIGALIWCERCGHDLT